MLRFIIVYVMYISVYIKVFHLVFETFPSLVWRVSSCSLAFKTAELFMITPLLLLCSC